MTTPETSNPKSKVYLTNKTLMEYVLKSKEKGYMTDELARALMLLTERYSKKGNFVNYTYLDDMKSYALMMLVRTWTGFDPERSNNPFAWFTQCIKNSFIQYLNQEKRHRIVRDELLLEQGLNPSHGFANERTEANIEDEQDYDAAREAAEILKKIETKSSGPIERDDMGEIIDTPTTFDEDVIEDSEAAQPEAAQ